MKPTKPPKKADKRRAWIKYQLELRGYSFASLARELGIHRTAPGKVHTRHYPMIEAAIAAKLGMHPAEIWPERYPDGADNNRSGRGVQ
jgi:Ner family transcriptional regulator